MQNTMSRNDKHSFSKSFIWLHWNALLTFYMGSLRSTDSSTASSKHSINAMFKHPNVQYLNVQPNTGRLSGCKMSIINTGGAWPPYDWLCIVIAPVTPYQYERTETEKILVKYVRFL